LRPLLWIALASFTTLVPPEQAHAQIHAPTGAGEATPAVDARHYDAFWLWAGVQSQPVLQQARRLYLLQGEVGPNGRDLMPRRAALPRIQRAGVEVWMVVRVDTLRWSPKIYDQMLAALRDWQRVGNRVVGIQIDFGARTHHLDEYAAFLTDLRQRLPADCRLSITGLLDWASHGDPESLNALAGVVDEAVLQIYQGRHVIPGYAAYLARLNRLNIPFRIGLLQGGPWQPPPGLEALP
jgi:hypothetical protein